MEEELTLMQVDELGDGFIVLQGPSALKKAISRALDRSTQIYTQVDGEDGKPIYLRGIHTVNRTGVYGVRISRKGDEHVHGNQLQNQEGS